MNSALTLVIVLLVLLILLLAVSLVLYHLTQQDLRQISARLQHLDAPKAASGRTAESVRRERATALDPLVVLEAGFSTEPREALTPEEISAFEDARRGVKACNAELKRMNEWVGPPFDLEWAEIQSRLPRISALYRRAVEAAIQEAEGSA